MSLRASLSRFDRADLRAFATFLATGGAAAAVNVASRVAFEAAFDRMMPGSPATYMIAIVPAFFLAMTTAFVLARRFVFARSGRTLRVEYGRFALVNLLALVQVWIVSVVLARSVFPALGFAWNAELIAHAIGVASPILVSYHAHKRFSFA